MNGGRFVARLCNGIGPKVAVLTAGIKNIEMLAKQDPDNLSVDTKDK